MLRENVKINHVNTRKHTKLDYFVGPLLDDLKNLAANFFCDLKIVFCLQALLPEAQCLTTF